MLAQPRRITTILAAMVDGGSAQLQLFWRLLFLLSLHAASAVSLYVTNASSSCNTDSSDGCGTGSLSEPFRSLQVCVDALVTMPAGSSCLLLDGVYSMPTVSVTGLQGELGAPYTIGGARGAESAVTIDGTLGVPGPWTLQTSSHTFLDGTTENRSHWVADWPDDGRGEPWQLFVDGELMVLARWPNARWDDRTVFDDRKWAHGSMLSTYCGDELRDDTYAGDCRIVDGTGTQVGDMIYDGGGHDLASSGFNATGASAVLNIGHWFTFAAPVVSHQPGTSSFLYAPDEGGGGWKAAKYKPTADLYYLEGSLELLDAETEWHYERGARRIHLKTRGDVSPDGLRVAARVQEYALAVTGCAHLEVRDLAFFATTVYVGGEGTSATQDVHNVRLDSLQLVHPSATKRALGDCRFSHPTTLARKKTADTSNNTVFNCTFFGAEGHPLINVAGSGITFENNLVEWTDWSAVTSAPIEGKVSGEDLGRGDRRECGCELGSTLGLDHHPSSDPKPNPSPPCKSNLLLTLCILAARPQAYFDPSIENSIWGKYGSGAMTVEMDRSTLLHAPNILRRNTIRHSGPSVGLAITSDNVHSELNHISHQFALQEDGGLMQMNGLKVDEEPAWGLTNERNWLHDALEPRSTKWGLRFDRVNSECYGIPEQAGDKTWAYHGTMERNVVWNCNGFMIKGNSECSSCTVVHSHLLC